MIEVDQTTHNNPIIAHAIKWSIISAQKNLKKKEKKMVLNDLNNYHRYLLNSMHLYIIIYINPHLCINFTYNV